MKFPRKNSQHVLSLTTTLAIAFFALSAVVLLISGGLQISSTIQAQREIVSSEQHLIAQDAAQRVSSFVQEKFSALETAVGLVDLATVSREQQKQILDSLLGPQPAFRRQPERWRASVPAWAPKPP